ncbi:MULTISPECIES: AzlC family ABC transporter permease [Ralstonia]|jgi:4-azaleucine resistance transporter AzlC|uniref:Inner membrane protein YgaZ n=1 Tax=Ralstonia flaminis TaxID=3058597 RepID=A0ABN9JK22_9RALS|nr:MULTISPECIES: AzlC family ABC transporter permease [unclassified Ralstonia]CAJ0814982.1 Inner membrane protein YgaZ [Ralstonia sp. LMG 18101]
MASPRAAEFRAGVLALAPMLLGVVPFGLIYGVLATSAGMPAWLAVAMSAIVFGGASQMILVQLWAGGAPALVIAATVSMVNLRHALYSASIAPALAHLPRRWKWLIAYLLTDEAFAAMNRRVVNARSNANSGTEETTYRHWYFLGAGVALWTSWQASTIVGVMLGAQVPTTWPLDFFLPLTFIAIVVPSLRTRAQLAAALTGAALAVAWTGWPHKLGLMGAACVGIAIGAIVERLLTRPKTEAAA